MAQALRTAWNASRHWLATGFLASTILFLLLMFINWRNEHRGIASQKATGLTSVSVDAASAWHQKSILPWSSSERHVRSGLDSISGSPGGVIGGVLGGVPGSVRLALNGSQPATPLETTERIVVRTGTLEIIVVDPLQAAEQLRDLATHLSGFVVSSRVSGMGLHNRGAAKGRLDGPAAYRAAVFSWTKDMAAPPGEGAGSIACNGNLHNSFHEMRRPVSVRERCLPRLTKVR